MRYRIIQPLFEFGLMSILGFLLITFNHFFQFGDFKLVSIFALFLLVLDIIIYFCRFQKKIHINSVGDLEIELEEKLSFKQPLTITPFWNYKFSHSPIWTDRYVGSGGYRQSAKSNIVLNVVIEDKDGKQIWLFQVLNQLHESPNDWNYQVESPKDLNGIQVLSLKKILKELKKH